MTTNDTTEKTTFYTPAQIADLLQIKRHTVYLWVRDGKLASVRVGSRVRIHRDALESFLMTK
jgi:excisionase family DNA binding protein